MLSASLPVAPSPSTSMEALIATCKPTAGQVPTPLYRLPRRSLLRGFVRTTHTRKGLAPEAGCNSGSTRMTWDDEGAPAQQAPATAAPSPHATSPLSVASEMIGGTLPTSMAGPQWDDTVAPSQPPQLPVSSPVGGDPGRTSALHMNAMAVDPVAPSCVQGSQEPMIIDTYAGSPFPSSPSDSSCPALEHIEPAEALVRKEAKQYPPPLLSPPLTLQQDAHGMFACPLCSKRCLTLGGWKCHAGAKHPDAYGKMKRAREPASSSGEPDTLTCETAYASPPRSTALPEGLTWEWLSTARLFPVKRIPKGLRLLWSDILSTALNRCVKPRCPSPPG